MTAPDPDAARAGASLADAPRSLTERLAALLARSIDAQVRERAALHVLDWLGCAVIGHASAPGQAFARVGATRGSGPCHAIGAGRRDAAAAALVNGAYGNVLEMDDIHRSSILHPGPVVVPAALAMAERTGADAASFLDAVVRGYDAVIRIGRSVGPGHYRVWHSTATCGPFGAAAACASLLGLDTDGTAAALGHAGARASGPWQCRLEGSMTKQLHTAGAAEAGLGAADLAAAGLTASRYILEGELGFYAALCPDPCPEAVLADAEGPWLVTDTGFKPWPACRHGHPTIDAVLAVREGVDAGRVERITVRTYSDAIAICDNPEPTTGLEARFSLQHCAAVALLDGPPPLAAFAPPALSRPDVEALRRRVALLPCEPYTSDYPQHYGAEVTLRLAGGEERTAAVTDALGDPGNPLSAAAIEDKARALMREAGLEASRVEPIVRAARALAHGGSVGALTGLLP